MLGVILGLALLFAFIDELNDISASYGIGDALRFIFLTAPRRAYDMLPMAALIGCLVARHPGQQQRTDHHARGRGIPVADRLGGDETDAGADAGRHPGWRVRRALDREHRPERPRPGPGGGDSQSSKRGLWHRQGREYIHINAVQPNGVLYGVTRYRFDEQRGLESASFAKRARFETDHWQLEEVTTTLLHPREKRSEVVKLPTERWDAQLSPQLLNTVVMEPEALSISGLWQYIHYLADQGLNNNRYWLAFWTKVLQPLVTAALVLMAISFIFGPLRSVTLGQRIFTGVLVGFVFRIAQDLLGPSSLVFDFPPLLAVVIPASICALAGVWLLRRAG